MGMFDNVFPECVLLEQAKTILGRSVERAAGYIGAHHAALTAAVAALRDTTSAPENTDGN